MSNATPRDNRSAMRILVLGSFRGSPSGSGAPAPTRADVQRVDIDNFDRLMARLEPAIDLELDDRSETPVRLVFHSLDDFHPDQLAKQDPILRKLVEIKRQLRNTATFSDAAADLAAMLRSGVGIAVSETTSSAAGKPPSKREVETDQETLERLLGSRPTTARESRPPQAAGIDEMIRQLVAPEVVADKQDIEPYLEAADAAAGDRIRCLLHHPHFQQLESAWRSLYELISQIDTEDEIEISLLSLGAPALREVVDGSGQNSGRPQLYNLLLETSAAAPDVEPWTLIIGDFLFGPDADDIKTLSEVGAICRSLGAIFLAGADPALLGCPDLRTHRDPRDWTDRFPNTEDAWLELRRDPAAQAIGLALPRVLLRLPYGQDTDPCDLFVFEEMLGTTDHNSFLWGNPAFFCARLLVQAYGQEGAYAPGICGDIDELPAYIHRDDTEATMQACAEVYLSEAAGEAITNEGFIPMLSYQRRNAVRLGPIQTLESVPPA